MKKLSKETKRKIIIGGIAAAGIIGGGFYIKYRIDKYADVCFDAGKAAGKDELINNYENQIFNKNFKVTLINDDVPNRNIYLVGDNQKHSFLKFLLDKSEYRAHAEILLGAKKGDTVKTF